MDAFLTIPPGGGFREGDITRGMICGGRIPEYERDTCQVGKRMMSFSYDDIIYREIPVDLSSSKEINSSK